MNEPIAPDPHPRVRSEIRRAAEQAHANARATPTPAPLQPTTIKAAPAPLGQPDAAPGFDALCAFHGAEFIEQATRALLGRGADSDTFAQLMARLASGTHKVEILGDLRWSPEGRVRGVSVPGLRWRYLLVKAGRIPVLGPVVQWLLTLASLAGMARHQRAADVLHVTRTASAEQRLIRLEAELAGQQQALASLGAERAQLHRAHAETLQFIADSQTQLDSLRGAVTDLLQPVLGTNHWLTSLRRTLVELEQRDTEQRQRQQVFATKAGRLALADEAHHREHLARLADRCAARLAAASVLVDAGADAEWSALLAERNIVVQALSDPTQSDSSATVMALERLPAGSLAALSLLEVPALLERRSLAQLLEAADRALQRGGLLVLGLDAGPMVAAARLAGRPLVDLSPELLDAGLGAAGFVEVETTAGAGPATCFIARAPATRESDSA